MTHGSLEERRKRLLQWIASAKPQGSAQNRVTVVFDGHPAYGGGASGADAGEIKVIFSEGENADACIKGIIERCRDPKAFVVVSDDKEIKLYTRALGAKVLGVKEFCAGLFGPVAKKIRPGKSSGGVGQKVTLTQADKINKELEKLWLKE